MSARVQPDARPETVPAEIETLDRIDAARSKPRILRRTLATYLLQIAMLGGCLARTRDHPPGNIVVWRGPSCKMSPSASLSGHPEDVGN